MEKPEHFLTINGDPVRVADPQDSQLLFCKQLPGQWRPDMPKCFQILDSCLIGLRWLRETEGTEEGHTTTRL